MHAYGFDVKSFSEWSEVQYEVPQGSILHLSSKWIQMKTNVEATKRQLQQRKFKKFNNLKYKPQPIKEQTPTITQAKFKKS